MRKRGGGTRSSWKVSSIPHHGYKIRTYSNSRTMSVAFLWPKNIMHVFGVLHLYDIRVLTRLLRKPEVA